jgi:RNA polymerase sigma-70 factor (ECF subfamily)
VLRVVGDPDRAEEAALAVFLELWRTSASFDPDRGSAMGWIVTLAHQRVVALVRDSHGTPQHRDPRNRADHSRKPFRDPAQSRAITAALAVLPCTQRRAIELAYFNGHTHSEVPPLLQVPLDATLTVIRTAILGLPGPGAVPRSSPTVRPAGASDGGRLMT